MTTTLLCLHGMDATGRVWDEVAARWQHGPVLAPDLAGHGTAPRLPRYHLADHARELRQRIGERLGPRVVVLGHSMGGAVGLAMAAGPDPSPVVGVVALGVKTTWSDEELASASRVADKGAARFEDERSARQRFLRVSGLSDLAGEDSELAASGVDRTDAGGWRLAVDPEVHRMAAIDFDALIAEVAVPVLLARGAADAMVPPGDLSRFGRPTVEIPGAGHNAHVEDPAATLALAAGLL